MPTIPERTAPAHDKGSDPRSLASSRVAISSLTERNRPFWTGGANGELLIARCQTCGWWLHPPLPVCRRCRGRNIRPEAVSGLGTVWSCTVNRYPWSPGLVPPYVIAEVELAEQTGLRLLTSIVDSDEVLIGMQVRVRFEPAGETWVPVFSPIDSPK